MTTKLNMRIPATIVISLCVVSGCSQTQPSVQTTEKTPVPAHTEASRKPDMTPVVAADSRIQKDILYVEYGGDQQKLDVYAPSNAKNAPVVIFVHGGEWTKGDKSEVSYKPKFFNENGIVFVSINYRLSGTAVHPAQADDVAAAILWLHDHVAEFGGDPQKLVLMGHSAGCHLVTLVSLDPKYLAKVNLKPSDLQAVVAWSGGAYNLPEKVAQGGMYADYIHKNFGDDEKNWRDASPMLHVEDFKPLPRFLFASAEEDKPASIEASRKMVSLIVSAGGCAEATLLIGKNHTTANHELGIPGDQSGEVLLHFIKSLVVSPKDKPTQN